MVGWDSHHLQAAGESHSNFAKDHKFKKYIIYMERFSGDGVVVGGSRWEVGFTGETEGRALNGNFIITSKKSQCLFLVD